MGSSGVVACTASADAREHYFAPSLIKGLDQRTAEKKAGMAAAIAWRESRRCKVCGAVGALPCGHRPNGAHGDYVDRLPAIGHMPFEGHRTVAQVDADLANDGRH